MPNDQCDDVAKAVRLVRGGEHGAANALIGRLDMLMRAERTPRPPQTPAPRADRGDRRSASPDRTMW
jgi:hypothetical protein